VLNVAYNRLCGGQRSDDIERRRNDEVFLDALGVASLPDPTTGGDFCRRFDEDQIMVLQEAINAARVRVGATQDPAVSMTATVFIRVLDDARRWLRGRFQAVAASPCSNSSMFSFSDGFKNPRVSRGRLLSRNATLSRSAWL